MVTFVLLSLTTNSRSLVWGKPCGTHWVEVMPAVARDIHGDGDFGLSAPITAVVCIASVVGALTLGRFSMLHNAAEGVVTDPRVPTLVTLGILTWRFIVWRRDKCAPLAPTSIKFPPPPTIVHLPQKLKPTHLTDTEKGQDYANQTPSPPPAYSPGPMKSSPASNRKSTPALSLNVTDCGTEETLPSPLRSASFNPSSKTQSWSSRISSRMSTDAKKLYVHLPG